MKFLPRPLSKKMIAHLQKARAIELSIVGRNICGTEDFKDTLPALHGNGMVDIKMVTIDEKEILCVYITKSGITFLDNYKTNPPPEHRNKYNLRSWVSKKYTNLMGVVLQNQ